MKYPPADDLMVRAVATPKAFDDRPHSMLVLRVRAKNYISSAAVHVSSDGQSYLRIADAITHVVGGRLLEAMPGTGGVLEAGPLIQILGPDAGTLRVLSEGDWKLGRQPMLLGDEWCFVRQLVAAGSNRYRPLGVLRGQMGSPVRDHPHGTQAFLADARSLQPLRDSAVQLGRRIWVKTQPLASQALPLTAARAWSFDLPKPTRSLLGQGEQPLRKSPLRFALGAVPEQGSLQLFLNGRLLRQGSRYDFRIDENEVILNSPPPEDPWVCAWYTPQEGT